MARSKQDDELTPIAKYQVFKKAFDTLNFFVASGNLIGAYMLAFSILEDRIRAAMVACFAAVNEPRKSDEDVSRVPISKHIARLKRVGAIDATLEKRLIEAGDLRNKLTHQMMWRLDVFEVKHVDALRNLINDVKRAHRAFLKQKREAL